jgi:two-component system response regulator YesN
LIVDDEKIVKLAIKSMIKWGDSGFELAGTASDGVKALQLCEKNKPDIIITDLKMPHMDGIEFIKRLKQMNYDGEILVLSNYNDFDLVREAMKYGAYDYILKVTVKSDDFMRVLDEIKDKLEKKRGYEKVVQSSEKNLDYQRNEFIKTILTGDEEELLKKSQEIPHNLKPDFNDCLQSFIVTSKDREAIKKTGQGLGEIIRNIAGNIFSVYNWYSVVEYEMNMVFILINSGRNPGLMSAKDAADRIIELANMYFNVKIGIVYRDASGKNASVVNEIIKCRKASELLFYDKFHENSLSGNVVPVNDEKQGRELALLISEEIYSNMVIGETQEVIKSFDNILDVCAQSLLNPYRLKKLIKKILRDVEKRLINNGYCSEEVFDEYNNDEDVIFSAPTESTLRTALKSMVEIAAGRIMSVSERACRKEVREALRYIDENITHKITVPQIAKKVNLTDTYLCKVFKTDVGKSIIDYINELKMKKAYELLVSKDYLIKEAAAAVGIDDQFYFNRLFKKYFGVTPKEVKPKM